MKLNTLAVIATAVLMSACATAHGPTEQELSEAMTHLAFYAGWPSALTAVTVARDVFEKK